MAEPTLVWLVAFVVFAWHQFATATPNVSLVFDSQGYLAVASSWLTLLSKTDFLARVGNYLMHGMPESQRVLLLQQIGSGCDIIKTGPVMPLLLAVPYWLTRTTATCQHWQIGVLAMIAVQSATVSLMWLIARESFGRPAARLSAVLGIFYSGFIINAGRINAEIPAACAVAFAAWLIIRTSLSHVRQSSEAGGVNAAPKSSALCSACLHGSLLGIALALVALSRSVLLLLPPVLLALSAWLLVRAQVPLRHKMALVICGVLSSMLLFAPWVLCQQIVTGHPGIAVNRHGPYNLFVGCDLASDGFDPVPSPYVSHPEQFTASMGDVAQTVLRQAAANPEDFVGLLCRKITRLIAAPWNDFRVACFGFAFPLQLWLHRLLLLMAVWTLLAGARMLRRAEDVAYAIPPAVLGAIAAYHMVYVGFISMSRYMFTAMPAVLILAAVGLLFMQRCLASKVELSAFVIVSATVPALSVFLSYMTSGMNLPSAVDLRTLHGIELGLLVAGVVIWFYLAARLSAHSSKQLGPIWAAVCIATAGCILLCGLRDAKTLEVVHELSNKHSRLQVLCAAPVIQDNQRCLLLVDWFSPQLQIEDPLRDARVAINGQEIAGQFIPLWMADRSQREDFVYQRVFAACAGVEPTSFRQWWALEIPRQIIGNVPSRALRIELSNHRPANSLYVAGNYWSPGLVNHDLSVRQASWTKGFFVGPPFESRLDVFESPVAAQAKDRGGRKIRPRVCLLVLEDSATPVVSSVATFRLPDVHIGKSTRERICQYEIPLHKSSPAYSDPAAPMGMKIEISGKLACSSPSATPSMALVETIANGGKIEKQLAPLMPSVIHSDPSTGAFLCRDIVPLPLGQDSRITGIKLIISGHPWFDMLEYANYRPAAAADFRQLQVKMQAVKMIDLEQQKFQTVKANALGSF
jgi:hypothetical protein